MTEAEWLACEDVAAMLKLIEGKASERKLRLFACACCRRVAHHLSNPAYQQFVEVGEQYADGGVSFEECQAAHRIAYEAYTLAVSGRGNNVDLAVAWATMPRGERGYLARYAEIVAGNSCRLGDGWIRHRPLNQQQRLEQAQQAALLRDIFGNSFRPVTFSPSWRTDTALTLAQQMYESRDFGAMPILADALQDAGCDSDDVLNHCRDANAPHVRGCWVVDLVLGKE
jgi:hypothetical protein